jgi:hypothetical protein
MLSFIHADWSIKLWNASVTSGYTDHADHADFFPQPLKPDVVSQPVNAWKNISGLARGPKELAIVWMGMYLIFFPAPKLIQSSSSPNEAKCPIARTTTSVSTVLIETDFIPC